MEEINLKEYFKILIKNKFIILVFTCVCILVSAVISFYVVKPVYESNALVTATAVELKSAIESKSNVIFSGDANQLDSASRLENKILGSIVNQINYPKFDAELIASFVNGSVFKDKLNQSLDGVVSISEIAVMPDKERNMISISVKQTDKENVYKVAKAIIEEIPLFIEEKKKEMVESNSKIIEEGLTKEKNNIAQWKSKLDSFYASVGGKDKIDTLRDNKQSEYQEVINNYTISKQAYESYVLVNKEFNIIKDTNIKELLNYQVITEPKKPEVPVSPKKPLIISVGGLFGFFISTFIVLFVDYWKKAGTKPANG